MDRGILFMSISVHSVILTSEAFQRLHTQISWRFLRSFVSLILGTGLLHEDTAYGYTPVDTEIDLYLNSRAVEGISKVRNANADELGSSGPVCLCHAQPCLP